MNVLPIAGEAAVGKIAGTEVSNAAKTVATDASADTKLLNPGPSADMKLLPQGTGKVGAQITVENGSGDSLPQNVQDTYAKYDSTGWKGDFSGQAPGTKAGGAYDNINGALPTTDAAGNPITYREFDVNNKVPGSGRDAEKFVVGSDGAVYYTDSHYGDKPSPTGLPSFVKVK